MKKEEMTPEQLEIKRKYDREAKQRSRAQAKIEKQKLAIPKAWDYVMPVEQQERLDQHTQRVTKAIQAQLSLDTLPEQDLYIVNAVASVLFGLDNNIVHIVSDPDGILAGGWFPDSAASTVIEHAHRSPRILQSAMFAELYKKFLGAVEKFAKKNEQYTASEFIQELKQEIAGTYTLPEPKREPKPESQQEQNVQEKPLPSTTQILEQGRIKLLNQIDPGSQSPQAPVHDPNVTPAVRRFLAGL